MNMEKKMIFSEPALSVNMLTDFVISPGTQTSDVGWTNPEELD